MDATATPTTTPPSTCRVAAPPAAAAARRRGQTAALAREKRARPAEGTDEAGKPKKRSLLDERADMLASGSMVELSKEEESVVEEGKILESIDNQMKPLMSVKELAKGVEYTESMGATWRPPARIRATSEAERQAIRDKWHILVEGEEPPPPIKSFRDMRFPPAVLAALASKGIHKPTPIQIQGLPAILAGRDMIGIAFTGSGKTLVFSLPLVMIALEEEKRMPLVRSEGPFGHHVPVARARAQTYDVVAHFCEGIATHGGGPRLRPLLSIGGISMRDPAAGAQRRRPHGGGDAGAAERHAHEEEVFARLCRYLCLDEADRMIGEANFEEEVAT